MKSNGSSVLRKIGQQIHFLLRLDVEVYFELNLYIFDQILTFTSGEDGINIYIYISSIFTNPSARAGYDTRSIFERSLTGFNSEFSFS